jgi:hypothetical protein
MNCAIFTVVIHFLVPAQNTKKNNSSEKRMPERPENSQKLVEEVQNYKD